jgi:hypothetical protein
MSSAYLRDAEWYKDETGWSEVEEQVKWIARSSPAGARAIDSKVNYLRAQTFDRALRSGLIKKPSATVYVLRIQTGSFAFRLPFFEPLCRGGRLIVFTECAKRDELGRAAYAALIERAEERRLDWIERNCEKEEADVRR